MSTNGRGPRHPTGFLTRTRTQYLPSLRYPTLVFNAYITGMSVSLLFRHFHLICLGCHSLLVFSLPVIISSRALLQARTPLLFLFYLLSITLFTLDPPFGETDQLCRLSNLYELWVTECSQPRTPSMLNIAFGMPRDCNSIVPRQLSFVHSLSLCVLPFTLVFCCETLSLPPTFMQSNALLIFVTWYFSVPTCQRYSHSPH